MTSNSLAHFTDRLAALESMDRLAAGDFHVLVLWGVAGQGKSTLLAYARQHRLGEHRVAAVDLAGLVTAGDVAVGRDGYDLAGTTLTEVARGLAGWASPRVGRRALADFEAAVRDARTAMTAPVATVTVSVSKSSRIINSPIRVDAGSLMAARVVAYRSALLEAVVALAGKLRRLPGILLLDSSELLGLLDDAAVKDAAAQAGGAGSWFAGALVPRLVEAHPGLRVVLAGRDPLAVPPPVGARSIELVEWTAGDTTSYLRVRGLDERLADTVHRLSTGVPVWASMLADLIAGADGPPVAVESLTDEVAGQTAEQWLTEEFLTRLPPDQRQVVIAAATLRSLTEEALTHLLDDRTLPDGWFARLRRYSFVRTSGGGSADLELHALVRAALIAHLEAHQPLRCQELHETAARYYRRTGAFVNEAYHRFATGEDGLADEWERQVQTALRLRALDRAARLTEAVTAPELAGRLATKLPGLYARGILYTSRLMLERGRWDEAIERADTAREMFLRLGDSHGEAGAVHTLGAAAQRRGDHDEAKRHFTASLRLYTRLQDRQGQANAERSLGFIAYRRADKQTARTHLTAALELHRSIGDQFGEAMTLRMLGLVATVADETDAAHRYLTASLELHKRLGDQQGEAEASQSLGNLLRQNNRFEDAVALLEHALALYRALSDRHGAANALMALGNLEFYRNRYDEAEPYLAAAHEQFEQLGDRLGTALTRWSQGDNSAARGRHDEAGERLAAALGQFIELDHAIGIAEINYSLGSLAIGQGRYAEGRSRLTAAFNAFEVLDDRLGAANAVRHLGNIARLDGDYDEALRQLTEALRRYAEFESEDGRADTRFDLARLAMACGDVAAARREAEEARGIYDRLDLHWQRDEAAAFLRELEAP